MDRIAKNALRAIMGRTVNEDDPEEVEPKLFEGKIKSVSNGQIKFTVPSWDGGKYEFGPVRYAVWSASGGIVLTGPEAGYVCLVMFPGGNGDIDSQRPWVIAWSPE